MEAPSERPAANVSAASLCGRGELARPGGGGSLRACAPLLCSRLSWKRWPRLIPPVCKTQAPPAQKAVAAEGETLLFGSYPPPLALAGNQRLQQDLDLGTGWHNLLTLSPGGAWRREDSDRRGTPFARPHFNHSGEGAKRPRTP